MLENRGNRLAKRTRWAARVIGTIAAVFFVGTLIASAVSEGIGPITVEIGTLALLGMLSLSGCIASWWRDMPAGILLILTSAGLGVHIGCFAGHNHALAWAMIGLPYLVAGILIPNSWRFSRPKS